jgi:hypothetical protein
MFVSPCFFVSISYSIHLIGDRQVYLSRSTRNILVAVVPVCAVLLRVLAQFVAIPAVLPAKDYTKAQQNTPKA